MSKFCIDLEGMLLPDAIAAVVEAWYEAQSVDNTGSLSIKLQPATTDPRSLFYQTNNFDDLNYEGSPWEILLRKSVFHWVDGEWSIGGRYQKPQDWENLFYQETRLTYIDDEGRSRWVPLPFEWSIENANKIRDYAGAIVDWVEQEGKTLANAYKRVRSWNESHES